jgi:hydrogenase-4 component D
MQALVIAVIAIPFVGAVACLAARDRASKAIAVLAGLLTAAAAVALAVRPPEDSFSFGAMPWLGSAETKGFFGYQLDPLGLIMLLASTVVGAGIVIYSLGYLSAGNREHPVKTGHARYFFWLLLFVGSMVGIALSPTLLQLLIFWEMTTLCSWALISFYDDRESLRAGMKALVMTSLGGLFFIGALVWVFSATGSMGFDALEKMSAGSRALAFVFFLIAAWAKSAQFPFHTWLPDAMAAPTPISAYLHAAAMVKAGVFLVARLLSAGWALPTGTSMLLAIAALVTMFAALILYFFQDDLKRLLAYSTIAQLGFILLGLGLGALGSSLAFRGAVLHILMHAAAKTLLFLSVGAIAYAQGTRSISRLSGLARVMPVATVGFFVGAFALAGIPPFACFWSKFYVLAGALQVPGAFGPIALILVVTESLISFAWYLWVGQKVFFGKLRQGAAATVPSEREAAKERPKVGVAGALDPPPSMDWIIIALVIACLAAPIVGIPLVQGIAP